MEEKEGVEEEAIYTADGALGNTCSCHNDADSCKLNEERKRLK